MFTSEMLDKLFHVLQKLCQEQENDCEITAITGNRQHPMVHVNWVKDGQLVGSDRFIWSPEWNQL